MSGRSVSRLFFGLPIRFSVFRQTLSDITLDRYNVKSDKLLCVNTAYAVYLECAGKVIQCLFNIVFGDARFGLNLACS